MQNQEQPQEQEFGIKETLTPDEEKQAEATIKKGAFPVVMTSRALLSAQVETLFAWVEVGKEQIIERINWKMNVLNKIGFFGTDQARRLIGTRWSGFMSPELEDVDYIRLDVEYNVPVNEHFSLLFQSPNHNIFLAYLAKDRQFAISTGPVGQIAGGPPPLPISLGRPGANQTLDFALSFVFDKADRRKKAGIPAPGRDQANSTVRLALERADKEGTTVIAPGFGLNSLDLADGMKLYEEAAKKLREQKGKS